MVNDLKRRIWQAEVDAIEAVESGRNVTQAQTSLLALYAERRRRLGRVRPVDTQPKEQER